jgi:hypothetical protein
MPASLPIKPTVIVPDAAPLIQLAAADALGVLTGMGAVVVVDVVMLETTYFADKPYAAQIAAWLDAGQHPRSNAPVTVAESDLGPVYRLALEQGVRTPRNAGEVAITDAEISAMRAASLVGGRTMVADVIVMLRKAGLPPPLPPPEQQAAELAHALKVLGLA